MFNEVKRILSEFNLLSSRKLPLVGHYVLGLMVVMKKHSFEVIAQMADCHPSRFSVLLNSPETLELSHEIFNRALRRKMARVKIEKKKSCILIDATFVKRRGKGVENSKTYYSGSGYVKGHKWLNIIFIHGGMVIPLATIPLYSKDYCKGNGLPYKTEPTIVVEWLNQLEHSGLFEADKIKDLYFLADSGYDCKKIQNSIKSLGAHFVIALKCSRTIKEYRVSEYFKRHKKGHSSSTIRFTGSGKKRITFQVRLATDVQLKGVGKINVVCSKGKRGSKATVKYIASSDQTLSARAIVNFYRDRWKIESWHKEVKQKYGYGDCQCGAFYAVHAHINFVLTAYLFQTMVVEKHKTIQDYQTTKMLKSVRTKLTQIGQVRSSQTLINEALQRMVA